METPNAKPWDYARFLSGVKTAALIVIIGAVAIAADQALFIGATPHAPDAPAPLPAAVSSVPSDGFSLADALRPTEADRKPPPPSF